MNQPNRISPERLSQTEYRQKDVEPLDVRVKPIEPVGPRPGAEHLHNMNEKQYFDLELIFRPPIKT